MAEENSDVLMLTGDIVSAYLSHNSVRSEDIPALIRSVRATLTEDTSPPQPEPQPEQTKATPGQIRKSVTPDALISFVDGKSYKTLKRHLSRHGMTMEDYKSRYGLPKDYPSVAPDYSARRSEMAKSLGLGARGRGRGGSGEQGSGGGAAASAPAKKAGGRGRKASGE